MTEFSVDVADIVVLDEELVEDGEDVEDVEEDREEDVEHAEVAEVGVAGEDAVVDEVADTLRTTRHLVMMTSIKEVLIGHLTLLLIGNLASISLPYLSQHVKVIFEAFFPPYVVDAINEYTKAYAQANIAAKPSHANKDDEWTPTTREEIYRLLSVLLDQALNRLPVVKDYWCTESLFDGNYVRSMIPSRMRFEALLCFWKVVDHEQEDPNDRLRKVRYLYDQMRDKYRTGTGEVPRLGQQTKIKTKTASNISHGPSGCTALAGRKR